MVKPSTMLYRNFLAMETEELLRSHPVDGAVLMGGWRQDHAGPCHGRHQHGPAGEGRGIATASKWPIRSDRH
jgi:hypothetical protein